jgi:hypothetical protein
MKRSPGEYALLHANGVPFAEIIEMVRAEQAEYLLVRDTGEQLLILDEEFMGRGDSYKEFRVTTARREGERG